MSEAPKNYITELCNLAINIARDAYLLEKVHFNLIDHLSLIHIIKCKEESPTNRRKRLVYVICSIHLVYIILSERHNIHLFFM